MVSPLEMAESLGLSPVKKDGYKWRAQGHKEGLCSSHFSLAAVVVVWRVTLTWG